MLSSIFEEGMFKANQILDMLNSGSRQGAGFLQRDRLAQGRVLPRLMLFHKPEFYTGDDHPDKSLSLVC